MRLEFYSDEKLKRQLLEIFGRHLNIKDYRVFIFGSRATGKNTERSDIDVGIEGEIEVPRETMARIKADIENLPTLYRIDLVDFKRVAQDFREVAMEKTETIYPPQ